MPITAAVLCLAANVFFEARDQDYDGRLAVMEVTQIRMDDHRYPDTICEVVHQPYAFSWTQDGASNDPRTYRNSADQTVYKPISNLTIFRDDIFKEI